MSQCAPKGRAELGDRGERLWNALPVPAARHWAVLAYRVPIQNHDTGIDAVHSDILRISLTATSWPSL